MLHAVIMAGGSGTRFWPASRNALPKQLLALSGERTMIQATSDRLEGLVPAERRMVLTNQALVSAVLEQLPEFPNQNVVGEPCKRDTAPCVGLAAAMIARKDPEGIMAVMPSDHVIGTPDRFRDAIRAGEKLVQEDASRIVTFGIKPSYPAESFGYIERAEPLQAAGVAAFQVARFREKPDRLTAQQYLSSGSFYWNSGIFLWRASTILDALKSHQLEMYEHLDRIAQAMETDKFQETLAVEFAAIKGTSIDYAVMESYPNVAVIEAPFEWDDVGSWQALERLNPSDEHGNTVVGSHYAIDTKGSIIFGQPGHAIVTIGIEDMIVVQTPDATLVAPKSAEERVREAVRLLLESNRNDCL
ncbi:mannose-1-phosphate guanylyltransferase [Stieleria varia]|uniref:mannose-1-phosphate guanylyltransferase n=1 Tax=Stieleria varia TaxID=2528005 RepID=A0A5C6B1E9_9BACT|nr:mannose-1-phosphate guanylyltransferase [Stieleria varia]TWU05637.1 Mannose-1-phosphate guanylyltransferase [Stieleria varia]